MRVVVKNLPPEATESAVRAHFSQESCPTDVRVLTTERGQSRGVAFIGYKTEGEGRRSILYYNRSYYNRYKLVVEELREREMEEPRRKKVRGGEGSVTDIGEMKAIVKLLAQKRTTWENEVEEEEEEEKGGEKEGAVKKKVPVGALIKEYKAQREEEQKQKVLETGEVFVRGIPYTATEEEVEAEFSKHGPVSEVYIKRKERVDSWGEGQSVNCGYALVVYTFPKDAYSLLGQSLVFQGRNVSLHPSTGRVQEETSTKNRTNLSHGKYNALFFNFSAVLGIAAKEKKVTKSLILKDKGTGLGGKIALLESELVEKTKAFLQKEGICEGCSCAKVPCVCMFTSKKSILLKNLPYNTKESEIKEFFTKYARLVFAPSKTLGILEYSNRSDALQELKKNNFSKIRDHPVYAEYLKVTKERYQKEIGALQADAPQPLQARAAGLDSLGSLGSLDSAAVSSPEGVRAEEGASQHKLILRNIPFQAGRSELSEMIEGIIGKEYKLRMPKKPDGTHRGFCFVEVDKKDLACTLLDRLKHIHLYGRRVVAEHAKL
ncbi:multiple RNA-binding domain-containing protein 1 [Nematocida sp. AWRm77]|nr:multiple RNA-binding domain-containing protein 1 [Nematocida sp. AWRm77]